MKRNADIDTVKGIGIFLVVFGHLNLQEPAQTIIYSFHIPLFFVVSGLLFRRENFRGGKEFLVRRLRSLIIPYLLFALATLAFYIGVQFLKTGFNDEFVQFAGKYITQVFIAQYSMVYGPNIPMWFVPCLFLTECIYFYISSISNKAMRCILVVIIVAFGWFTQSSFCRWDFSVLPWNFSGACFALGFYAIGNMFLQKYGVLLKERYKGMHGYFKVLLFTVLFAVLFFLAERNGHVSIGSRLFHNGFIFYATGMLGTALVLMTALLADHNRFLRYWGKNSFLIMATHIVFYNILSGLVQAAGGDSLSDHRTSLVHSFAAIAAVMAACSIFSVVYNGLRKMKNRGLLFSRSAV